MQTFLPYADFSASMACLDPSRLGNQVYREGMTLIRGGWPNHPAAKMWAEYPQALAYYLMCGAEELDARGFDYRDRPWFAELCDHLQGVDISTITMPPWLGNEAFHASHRGVLLWKNPEWYGQFGWDEQPRPPRPDGKMDYVWPGS